METICIKRTYPSWAHNVPCFFFGGHFALFAYVISLVFIFVEHRGLTIFLCSSLSPCYCSFNLVVTFHHSLLHWAIVATL
jgi:hypothetical protein